MSRKKRFDRVINFKIEEEVYEKFAALAEQYYSPTTHFYRKAFYYFLNSVDKGYIKPEEISKDGGLT